ncbi:MAG: VCBS repeat-containing protein, partial [Ginsengibacter sp.]
MFLAKQISFFFLLLCFQKAAIVAQSSNLFTLLASAQTNVTFQNKLTETPEQNIIAYEYFYNGGGVAVADFNNDGLLDVYFSSNQQADKLYINKGQFKFEDVTKTAGVAVLNGWKTGVSVADVNSDGFVDIYVCLSGNVEQKDRRNKLFINNGPSPSGEITFTESAEKYGVADMGYTTQAAFFDYDRDGDLDLYVLNHNNKSLRNFDAAFVK